MFLGRPMLQTYIHSKEGIGSVSSLELVLDRIMSFEITKRSRKPSCTLCSNHGIRSDLKGHKYHCKFSDCECSLCYRGRERREVMRKQVKLRRHQMRDFAEKTRRNAEVKLTPPQRMMPHTHFEPRLQAPMCNVSPGYPTIPRFPPRVMPFSQTTTTAETMAAYFAMNMPSSPSPRAVPLHRLSPVSGLNVSDNSAFVRFSPQPHAIHGAISNAWPSCEVAADPKEAALALASLQHKTKALRLKYSKL